MYNITLRRICVTIVAVEKQQVLHILSVFITLGIQHVHHVVIFGLSDSTIFLHIIS